MIDWDRAYHNSKSYLLGFAGGIGIGVAATVSNIGYFRENKHLSIKVPHVIEIQKEKIKSRIAN